MKEKLNAKTKIYPSAKMKPMTATYQPTADLQVAENLYKTKIEGLYYLRYPQFPDQRGLFAEILKPDLILQRVNPDFVIKQVNYSYSLSKVVRGFHAEGWNKLVTIIDGEALCVLADTRRQSPTFKQVEYFNFKFNPQGKWAEALYISKKIANSICVLQGPLRYVYGVDLLYSERDPADDQAISLFDPELNIDWPLPREEMIISQRDQQSVLLKDL